MPASPLLEEILLGLFRHNTRGFLRLEPADGRVPPAPAEPCHLYVHVPFCAVLCPFCSFHRVPHQPGPARRYFASVRRELELYRAAGYRFNGAYFGGGTPTCEPDELIATLAAVRQGMPEGEISVETNPRDLSPDLAHRLRAAGVTRLSVGVQSFDDRLLQEMGRLEGYGSSAETVARLQAVAGIFPTLNVDLIFNQPHQSVASFERDLAIFRATGADQVSCYPLMTSPDVRRRLTAGMGVPDRRRLRRFYGSIARALAPEFAASSAWCFSRPRGSGDEYIVTADHYVGLGSGAFGYLDGTLHATTFSLAAYEQRVAEGLTGVTASRCLSEVERMRYGLLVKLFGLELHADWVKERFGPAFRRRLWGELATLRLMGATRRTPRGWTLTESGRYWLMLMMAAFFESVNAYRDRMRGQAERERALAAAHAGPHPAGPWPAAAGVGPA